MISSRSVTLPTAGAVTASSTCRREELLTDVLRQYERYIRIIANSKHNLYLFDKKNDET